MTSARKLKQRSVAFGNRHFVGAIAVGDAGDVTLHLPRRRKPISLTCADAELIQALLALRGPQSTVACASSSNPSSATCGSEKRA